MKKIVVFMMTAIIIFSILIPAFAEETYIIRVSAPNGAPALSIATLAVQDPDSYTFVAADTIAAEFANKTADFIIAPVNAGAKLYQSGKSIYKLAGVVTWGNLYIASQKPDFTLEDINGASITLFGENTINASVVLFALAGSGLEPSSVEYLAGAANTQSLLLADNNAIVVTAEPALTAAKMKNESITAYSVNDLYQKVTGYDGYTQAGLFVNAETIETYPETVSAYLALAEEAANKAQTDVSAVAEAAVALEILPNLKVASAAIPNCAIHFMSAVDAKDQIETTAKIDLGQFGGSVPADDFYYQQEK